MNFFEILGEFVLAILANPITLAPIAVGVIVIILMTGTVRRNHGIMTHIFNARAKKIRSKGYDRQTEHQLLLNSEAQIHAWSATNLFDPIRIVGLVMLLGGLTFIGFFLVPNLTTIPLKGVLVFGGVCTLVTGLGLKFLTIKLA